MSRLSRVELHVRRNWWIIALLIVLFWTLGTFISNLFKLAYWIVGLVNKIFGSRAATVAADIANDLLRVVREKASLFLIVLTFISPIIGFYVSLWTLLDEFRRGSSTTTAQEPIPSNLGRNDDPDVGDDLFNPWDFTLS